MHLDEITARIDSAFGEQLPFSGRSLEEDDLQTLERVFGDEGYQVFLQDQVSRHIIRDYLTNAVLLGHIGVGCLVRFTGQLATCEGRSSLSLHMLMCSVEEAASLPVGSASTPLEPLRPGQDAAPILSLVPK